MRSTSVASAVLLGLAAIAAAQDSKIEVKLLPQPGTYVVRTSMLLEIQPGPPATQPDDPAMQPTTQKAEPIIQKSELVIEMTVSPAEAGGATVFIVPKHMKIGGGPDGKIDPQDGTGGDPMTITLNRAGQVVSAERQTRRSSQPFPDSQPRRPAASAPAKDSDVMKKAGQDALSLMLPHQMCVTTRPVAAGEQWQRDERMSRITSRLKSLENGVATIDVDSYLNTSRGGGGGSLTTKSRKIMTLQYDVKLGLATAFEVRSENDVKYQSDDPRPRPPSPLNRTTRRTISGTVTPGPYKESAATRPAPATQPANY